MKKIFLSAIMMIAFSGVSMANCIAEDNVKKEAVKNDSSKSTVQVMESVDCDLVRFKAYVTAISAGLTDSEASGVAYNVYFHCKLHNLQQAPK